MDNTAPTFVTGAKEFDAISDNRGVVVGDLSGHAQAIGVLSQRLRPSHALLI